MNRLPGNYSRDEFQAPQGHDDRVRTADCHKTDQLIRQSEGNDSELESDWYLRTSKDNNLFRTRQIFKEKSTKGEPKKKGKGKANK